MELDKGSNFRIDLNIVRDSPGQMDITYLVKEIFVLFVLLYGNTTFVGILRKHVVINANVQVIFSRS